MPKRITTVYVEDDLMKMVKELEINLSEFVNEQLQKFFKSQENDPDLKEFDEIIEKIDNFEKKINDARERVMKSKEKAERKKKFFQIFDEVQELQSLSSDDLADTDYIMSLIKRINEKNDIRAGFTDIKDYLKWKNK